MSSGFWSEFTLFFHIVCVILCPQHHPLTSCHYPSFLPDYLLLVHSLFSTDCINLTRELCYSLLDRLQTWT
ncbi:hypothetical protein BJY04DRAFT_122532 [Aspergillus karnatakaensis]|uniref:uncharacterized protein n=1 Tax=Aspergillus karnatakaensis TaxID=1810916 RepID=UPI003CCD9A9D